MDERGADQPRHERRVLHRIPEPPTAPAEFVVRPPTAEGDSDGLEQPRKNGPWPGPLGPRLIEPSLEHGRNGKRERDGKSDVSRVQHGRMNGEREVLQYRVQVSAVLPRGDQTLERVGGPQCKQ